VLVIGIRGLVRLHGEMSALTAPFVRASVEGVSSGIYADGDCRSLVEVVLLVRVGLPPGAVMWGVAMQLRAQFYQRWRCPT
jgi:hypothetical protein